MTMAQTVTVNTMEVLGCGRGAASRPGDRVSIGRKMTADSREGS